MPETILEEQRLFNKLSRMDERLEGIAITLAEQHLTLKEHMRRTELLEDQMKVVWGHVVAMRGLGKVISVLAALVAILGGIVALVKMKV